jgi:inward rectifier potassium channel
VLRLGGARHGWRGEVGHFLLTVSWPGFIALAASAYCAANLGFALLYLACGQCIENARQDSLADAFFFSIQTLATIGYGRMTPVGAVANLLVAVEALAGGMGLAVLAGLGYARFTRPTAGVMFSRRAVVGSFDGRPALMLRIANRRTNEIVEAGVDLVLARNETLSDGAEFRRFYDLAPLRRHSPLFNLSWTVIHPIDEASPLAGASPEALERDQAELLVVFWGHDEGFAQTVHARHAYDSRDIVWNARFANIFTNTPEGRRTLDFDRFDLVEPL